MASTHANLLNLERRKMEGLEFFNFFTAWKNQVQPYTDLVLSSQVGHETKLYTSIPNCEKVPIIEALKSLQAFQLTCKSTMERRTLYSEFWPLNFPHFLGGRGDLISFGSDSPKGACFFHEEL